MSRRKTKTERELVADINDVFRIFCHRQECRDCPYRYSEDCKLDYIRDLIEKEYENKEEE